MKKLLLTLATVLLGCITSLAGSVTFDFVNNSYDMTRYTTGNDYNADNQVLANVDGITLTNKKSTGNGTRLWTDGLRFYSGGKIEISSSTEEISNVTFTLKSGSTNSFTVTNSNGIWTLAYNPTSSNLVVTTLTVEFGEGTGGGGTVDPGPEAPKGEITVAEALSLIKDGYVGEATVKGIVSRVTYFNATYGSVTYYISDDGGTTNDLQVYGGLGLDGAKFNAQSDVEVGASVVVKGDLKMYNGTPEFDTNSVMLSYTAPTGGGTPEPEPGTPEDAVTQPFKTGLNFPEGTQAAVPTSPTTITASDTGITYTLYGTNVNTAGYLMMSSKNVAGAYISWSLTFPMSQLIMTNTSGASKNAVVNVYANDQLIKENLALTELSSNYTVDIPTEYQKAGTTYKVESASTQYNTQFASFTYVRSTDEPVVPEPANSVTFEFSGVEDAYKYVTMLDMRNGDVPIEITSNELVWKYDNMFQFNVSPTSPDSPYTVEVTCDQPAGTAYQIMGMGADGFTTYIVGGFPAANGYVFNVIVTKAETPEVTVNLSGAYKDGITMALSTNDDEYEIIDLTSDTYSIDLSQYADGQFPLFLSFQTKEGYSVEVEGNLEEGPNTYLIMPIGQGGSGTNVIIFPGAAGLELTANVTAEAEEIPADAYVVYYNGEVASDLTAYDWWNADWNPKAMNPDGQGMALEINAGNKTFDWGQGGYGGCSMGLSANNAMAVGPLHNGILTMEWTTVGNAKYTLRLTGGGKDYDLVINDPNAPAGTATWNTTTINIAEEFPELAAAWNVVTKGGPYVFGIVMEDGEEGDAIYFNKIYYTNVDESWTALPVPAPETVPAPEQPQDMMLSVVSDNGSIQYSFGSWGQSTQAENTFIAGSPVIAMTDFNYLGLEFSAINVSDYDYMHVDYWTNSENTPFTFVPISLDPTQEGEPYKDSNVKANEWNSYDAPLSSFAANMEALRQIKFTTNVDGHDVTPYGYIANVYFWKEEVAEPNVLTLNITGGDDAWQHVNVYNAVDEEEVILTENTYSISNYGTGLLLSVSPKEGYEVEVTIGTEGLIENKDYQIISQDVNDVVQYAIGMLKNDFDVEFNVVVEKVAEPTVIYVMGSGDGLTWDTFPGMKVEGENGIVTFNVNNLVSFKASTVEATTWEEFNEGAYATGNTTFGDAVANAGGQTLKMEPWGENQSVPWKGDYTITMNFNTMEMTAYTTTPKPVEAPVMYVRGSMNNWGTSDAWKFTNESWDATAGTGTYSIECKLAPGQTFKFDDGTWGNYNFGGSGAVAINEEVNLVWNGGDLTVSSDFDGKITLNLTGFHEANAIFEMEGPIKDPDQFYVIGTLAEGAWNPTVGVKMESNGNGKYTAEKVTLIESEGSTGFAITANLGTDSNDWTSVNALRFGPAQNDAMAVIGENTGIAMGDLSWTFTPGTYTMVFDYTNKTLNIEEYVEPELPDNIDVTFDFNSYDNVKEYAGLTGTMEQEFAQQGSTRYYIIKKLLNGGIEITGDKGTYAGSLPYNAPYVNVVTTSGSMTFRMQVGNTFTISAPEGYTLKNVTFGGTMANYVSGPVLVAGEPGTIGAATTSSPYTRTWTAPEEGTVNTLTFTLPSGSCILKTINVVAEKVEESEPALNTLVFEDWTMEVPTELTVEVPVSLDVEKVEPYQGFQFDFTLPEGLEVRNATLSDELPGSINFSLYSAENNTYRVVANMDWAEDAYTLTENLASLSVAAVQDNEGGYIKEGNYEVMISEVSFSTAKGEDIFGFNSFKGTVTIVNAEVPATNITFESVTLMKPSYTTPSSDMIEQIVQGESVAMEIVVTPKDTTDELEVTASNGAFVEFDEETGNWILDTTGVKNAAGEELAAGETIEVTVTATAGDVTETYTITVKGVILGDSNDNGVVTVADVVTTANYMVETPVETFCFPNANVILTPGEDGEQVIDAADLTATINIVLDDFDGNRQIRRYSNRTFNNDRLVADNFKAGNSTIAINLDNTTDYAALQATIVIPEGVTVNKVTKGIRAKDHELTWNYIATEGVVKVVLYSLENKSFPNVEGSLFNIEVTADEQCGDFTIIDINASNAKNNGFDLSFDGGFFEANATGVDGIGTEDADVRYFTVDGIEVFNPEHGQILIRIQNGEATKVMVK